MLSVYPFASGSLYTASFATTASHANTAQYITYVESASYAGKVLFPTSGSRGKSICTITYEQYLLAVGSNMTESCAIPPSGV